MSAKLYNVVRKTPPFPFGEGLCEAGKKVGNFWAILDNIIAYTTAKKPQMSNLKMQMGRQMSNLKQTKQNTKN